MSIPKKFNKEHFYSNRYLFSCSVLSILLMFDLNAPYTLEFYVKYKNLNKHTVFKKQSIIIDFL